MLQDTRGRYLKDLRISVTDSCNFRCTYCMPREIFGAPVPFTESDEHLTYEEIRSVAAGAAELGVSKIKITGGEPLLRPWLPDLVRMLYEIPGIEDVGLITNGYHLAAHAKALKRAGLRRITISLDSLEERNFGEITGKGGSLQRVLESIRVSRELGFDPIKINMVVQRGVNDHEIPVFAETFREPGTQLRFIEFMDVGVHMDFDSSLIVPNHEILALLQDRWDLEPVEAADPGETARRYAHSDGKGEIGFISSMTKPFCHGCTRLRLTADGELFTCLFAKKGFDIRSLARSQGTQAIIPALRKLWSLRDDNYSEERLEQQKQTGTLPVREQRPEMYHIGG